MGILEALKNDIEKTYEYKVGFQEGYSDGVLGVLDDLDELLEDIKKYKYDDCNMQTGDEWNAVDIRDVETLFKKFEERYTK